jgi:hypothetical protein
MARTALASSEDSPTLGLNTYSLRALPQDEAIPVIIDVMKRAGLRDCQLFFSHVEPAKLSQKFPAGLSGAPRKPPTPEEMEQRKATAAALTEWRMTVAMSYFEDLRSTFRKAGVRIRALSARLGSTEEEVDRQFQMGQALGVDSMVVRPAESMTAMLAAVAGKHAMKVGIQFTDATVVRRQLAASPLFSMDPDIGDLTKLGIDALHFVRENSHSISSLDLKDAKLRGVSVPFGQGDSQMAGVLAFLRQRRLPIIAYIDCDYAETGRSPEEVLKCVQYVRKTLACA